MKAFVNGIGFVAPFKSLHFHEVNHELLCEGEKGFLSCLEPDYKEHINPMASRRMSRNVKMGIFSAKTCLSDAGIEMPDAIITGTGLGCIEDTEKFLTYVIQNKETLLNPTPFIQSTHNTVSSQIALFIKCHGYNMTYSHRNFSFETALLDSLMLFREGMAQHVLTGGIDELTMNSFQIQKRMGMWRDITQSEKNILTGRSRGAFAGEGSAFLMLSRNHGNNAYARISAPHMIGKKINKQVQREEALRYLSKHGLTPDDIDLVLAGYCGDRNSDELYDELTGDVFSDNGFAYFKHLSGDYQTVSSFAAALAATVIKSQRVPPLITIRPPRRNTLRNVLIYNHFFNSGHSFILLQNV